MALLTQNNKIAIAAVSIFFVSFSAMLFLVDKDNTSPEYLKADVVESAMSHGGESSGHSVFFSDEEGSHEGDSHEENSDNSDLENMYRILIDDFTKPIFVLYPEGKTKFLSGNFSEDYGYELNEMEEDVFFSYIYPTDLPDFVTEYTSVIQSGTGVDGVGPYRFVNKDGALSVHLVNLLPVVNDEGKVVEIIGSIRDITEKVENFGETLEEEEDLEIDAGSDSAEEDIIHINGTAEFLHRMVSGNFS